MDDRSRLYLAAFLRALATGMAGVSLGLHLARLDFAAATIGLILSAGLLGAVAALFAVTWWGDRLGRRRCLLALSLLGAGGGVAMALGGEPWVILAAAIFGMMNGMGRDRGAAMVLEQAILPDLAGDAERTRHYAWYNLLGDIGHALGALFGLDSVAGGFLGSALLSYFFFERFGVSEVFIAGLFFAARGLNALSHLGAAWLAGRIGLVNTMVFTHIPSSLLLMTVACADSFALATVLFLLREALVGMDVPTRQSYVMAVVLPEERTFATGVTHLGQR